MVAILLPLDKDGVGDAHLGSSAPDGEILQSTEPVCLLKKLQLLADSIPLADHTRRASRRPSKDAARHGGRAGLLTNLSSNGSWGHEI